MLQRAGVRHVDENQSKEAVGFSAPGLLIPYVTRRGDPIKIDGKIFARIRLTEPKGNAKYLSPAKSGCHIYEPPGLAQLLVPGCTLLITEGEFKSMALVEAGFPCVGIGGITSACPKGSNGEPELIPWLADLIAEAKPSRIAFCGDSDTSLIPEFAREAIKLAKLLPVPLILPRISYDAPGKAADDLREIYADTFVDQWQAIMAKAEPAPASLEPDTLALRLLRRDAEALGNLDGDANDKAQDRLVRMASAFHHNPRIASEIEEIGLRMGLKKTVLRAAVKELRARQAQQIEDERSKAAEEEIKSNPEPPLYFDGSAYWRKEIDGRFGRLGRDDALLHMADLGLSRRGSEGMPSPAEEQLLTVQRVHRVTAAMPLCGRPTGLYTEGGHRILVTAAPTWIKPGEGDPTPIVNFLADLFGRHTGDELWQHQLSIFIAWLKTGRNAFAASLAGSKAHSPAPVLAVVGPPDCGKSMMQSMIITAAFGGREEDPGKALLSSDFNANLWRAEHLVLADKALDGNGTQRERLRLELKAIVANSSYPLHPKGKDQITLRPVWRVSLTANDDPESAADLPTLESSFADKIIYLRCYAPPAPFYDEEKKGAREAFADKMKAALPAFFQEVDTFDIPTECLSSRWGVAAWHHPEILELIAGSDSCLPVVDEIASWVRSWEYPITVMEGNSTELLEKITEQRPSLTRFGLVSGARHFGHLLARISRLEGLSFSITQGKRNELSRKWTIAKK